jgi:hypothetical protein
MKTTKEILTKKFGEQKRLFNIYEDLDDFIKSFIIQLNEHPDIVTHYSCEGASSPIELGEEGGHSVWAYLGLNISERYWDYFWSNVIPDIMRDIDIKLSTNYSDDAIFLHSISLDKKYEFWDTVFKVFKKHNIIKEEKIIEFK